MSPGQQGLGTPYLSSLRTRKGGLLQTWTHAAVVENSWLVVDQTSSGGERVSARDNTGMLRKKRQRDCSPQLNNVFS